MRLLLLPAVCLLLQTARAQVKATGVDKQDIPKSIHFKGAVDTAITYTDKDGEHLVVTTEDQTSKKNEYGDDTWSADVYAYCYKMNAGQWQLQWQVHDFANECQEDVSAGFLPHSFAVTDLDKDGKAEIWLMYRVACRGDVSPSSMKVIMHEGDKKYGMRGSSRVKVNATDYYGGEYKFDEVFKAGPAAFRQYAQALWKKNLFETFGN